MPTFRIRGVAEPSPRPNLAKTVEGITPKQGVRVESGRAGSQLQTLEGDFAEVVLTGGVRLWGRTEQMTEDLADNASRAGDSGLPVWNVRLGRGPGSRSGGKDLAIEAVETFNLEIAGEIRDFIKNRVEKGMEPGGLLRQCVTTSASALGPATRIGGSGPTLVFIHGTASSTDGSFGGLWDAVGSNRVLRIENPGARINALVKAYEGRVFAFEHRSLSESPIVNAEALMNQLAAVVPGGRELHLVSHSRGGMIGELLTRGMRRQGLPIDPLDLAQFRGDSADREADRTTLPELGRLLNEQRYAIGRFVRVACPAAGTTLASGRIDRYVSLLVNVAGLVTGLGADPLYNALTNLLAAVLKERTDPTKLPGLEAMMPTSPLTRMLNRRDVLTGADLHVLGGDLAVRGFWSALKALATDFFYLEDHDLVVNTPSMLRGTPRAGTVKYFIDTDSDVSHFNYFRRPDTADRLTRLLTGGSAEFRDLEVEPHEVDGKAYQKRDAAPMPTLVLVPGFMGSHLAIEDGRVWADPGRLAQGGFATLATAGQVSPEALVGPYAPLVHHLSASHEVVPFPYDWRKPAAENAKALCALLKARLGNAGAAGQPIRILTHGAGGFVLQALMTSAEDDVRAVWSQVSAHPGARAVLLGHPHGGTVHALLPLLRRGSLFEGLASIDLKHQDSDLVKLFAGFEGLLELLPDPVAQVTPTNWFKPEDWSGTFTPPAGLVGADSRRRRLASAPLDAAQIVHVAGTAPMTPAQASLVKGQVAVQATPDGDGYSSWSAIPIGLRERTWLSATDHGGLIASKEVWPAIVDLLTTGVTRRLGRMKVSAGSAPLRPFRLPELHAIPSDAELVAAGLGIGVRAAEIVRPKVRVRVVHGSLSRATSPVVVGHYDQDVFANAEDYLDRQLDGRLRDRRLMRLYPGPIGTTAVEIRPGDESVRHPGAIVVGLGVVGSLTAGSLIRTLEEGLTAYGAEKAAEDGRRPRDAESREMELRTISAPVTALLVGSGEAGLSLRDSVHALLRAVLGANDRLAGPATAAGKSDAPSLPLTARIETLDLIELYEDRAVEALRMLLTLARDAEFAEALDVVPVLEAGTEGRQRVSFEEPAVWWQRLRVTEHDASIDPKFPTSRKVLKFEAYAEGARIDAYAVNSQRELATAFISDALMTTESNKHLGRTLFEMLVPNDIKERAPDRRDTVLLLDAASAAIPWELFENGLGSDDRPRQPLAIEAGLIRQLVDEHPRQHVRQTTENHALVVGNPKLTDSRFADLEGAQREALAVRDRLAPAFAVELLIQSAATPRAILTALHEKPWRILHLALHGVFKFPAVKDGKELVTGAVVGDGVYLEPADFNQMRYVPELVFLNCCHVGFTGGEPHVAHHPELAANLATQFIKMGAKAVVAAGWAVNDQAAERFAYTFYEEMLAGQRFGEATTQARRTIHRQFPQYNTWGAYQCYGDPEFVLTRSTGDGAERPPVYVREVIVAAEAIATEAKLADESACESLRKRLDAVVRGANESWLRDARLAAALGAAYGELSDFERAIEYYEVARSAEKATFAVAVLEQLANFEARYAEHLWRAGTPSTVDERFDRATRLLARLIDIEPSAERYALLGGVEKRRAMTRVVDADVVRALVAAEAHYRDAYLLKRTREHSDASYPFSNAVVARLARAWLGRGDDGTLDERPRSPAQAIPALSVEIDELESFETRLKAATDFWSLSFFSEAELLRRVYRATTANDAEAQRTAISAITARELVALFQKAQKRGRSHREMDSVVTQVRFLAVFAARSASPHVKAIGNALDELVRRLTAVQSRSR